MSSFSETLKKLRIQDGLTQAEAARQMGITRSALGMYETGKREPDFETLELIADFYNVDMNTLYGRAAPSAASGGSSAADLVNNDPALTELLERYRDDPGYRMLFSVTRDATPEDIQKAVKIIQTLKGD